MFIEARRAAHCYAADIADDDGAVVAYVVCAEY